MTVGGSVRARLLAWRGEPGQARALLAAAVDEAGDVARTLDGASARTQLAALGARVPAS